jgi:hypothetical protein
MMHAGLPCRILSARRREAPAIEQRHYAWCRCPPRLIEGGVNNAVGGGCRLTAAEWLILAAASPALLRGRRGGMADL